MKTTNDIDIKIISSIILLIKFFLKSVTFDKSSTLKQPQCVSMPLYTAWVNINININNIDKTKIFEPLTIYPVIKQIPHTSSIQGNINAIKLLNNVGEIWKLSIKSEKSFGLIILSILA